MSEYELIDHKFLMGDDGLIANNFVGNWAIEKHNYLTRYLDISRGVRSKFVSQAGATYIDLFCATGRGQLKFLEGWIDGSPIAAWKKSLEKGVPFSKIYIADADEKSLDACEKRLKKLGAPVKAFHGKASETVKKICAELNPYGLHFAFIDPYSLTSLDFEIIKTLSQLRRIDILIHFSVMDLNRNALKYLKPENTSLENVVPGFRNEISLKAHPQQIRSHIYNLWRKRVEELGTTLSITQKLITGEQNQPLYYLVMAAKSNLAQKFWEIAIDTDQINLF